MISPWGLFSPPQVKILAVKYEMLHDNNVIKYSNNWEADLQQHHQLDRRALGGGGNMHPFTQYLRHKWSGVITDNLFLQTHCVLGKLKQLQSKHTMYKPSQSTNNGGSSVWDNVNLGCSPHGCFCFLRFYWLFEVGVILHRGSTPGKDLGRGNSSVDTLLAAQLEKWSSHF